MNKDNKDIASVKAVMKTLNVSMNDLIDNNGLMNLLREKILSGALPKSEVQHLLNEMPEFKSPTTTSCKMLRFSTHGTTGLEYALNGGDVVGPIITGKGIRYVLALKNIAQNLTLEEAEKLARMQESVGGFDWIVPCDDHFKAMIGNLSRINTFLEAYGGDKIGHTPFLSTSFQHNKPQRWNVRFILPLPLKI